MGGLSDKCRKRLSSKMSELAKEFAEDYKEANIELTKIRVTGNAKVAIIAGGSGALLPPLSRTRWLIEH